MIEIVKKKKKKEFHVLPRRWVVERTFAWLNRYRRLIKITSGNRHPVRVMFMLLQSD
ncbi:hypothetical protein BN874_1760001 [Candidatus Contendobacter odensis Run_B_J11]|uniref:Transposase DDE domain-containing protein n=1 Tax=Candidatus Contendobacter odensis Run_B_J11 TaxID=1400861 RepID=A0A7U7GA89_9GAMM|nr:hypothetical protein BN874_1760001 [Candidatus Contendobacter odensis Run_B_J11]